MHLYTLIQEVGGGERLEGLEVLYRTKNVLAQLPVEQGPGHFRYATY